LQVATLWRGEVNRSAIATSQLFLVQQNEAMKATLNGKLADFEKRLSDFTEAGYSRISENADNFNKSRIASEQMLSEMHQLFEKMTETTNASVEAVKAAKEATEATRATHAKVSQKIITGPEAEALKRAANQKDRQIQKLKKANPPVIKFWPWQ
jgi:hypothetical protein